MESRRSASRVAAGLAIVAAVLAGAAPARANEADGSTRAADLVRQAIAIVVNKPGGLAGARERIADTREAKDRSGVDVSLLEQADGALAAGDVHQGRALLEQAIGARPHTGGAEPAPIRRTTADPEAETTAIGQAGNTPSPSEGRPARWRRGNVGAPGEAATPMEMARGAEPGTGVVSDPLDTRPALDGGDRSLLLASLAVGLAGVSLGVRFRPRKGVGVRA